MSEPTREEKCKAIAEWLEPSTTLPRWDDYYRRIFARGGHEPEDKPKVWKFDTRDESLTWKAPDFYTDETASMVALEKMPSPVLAVETLHARQWGCWPLGLSLTPPWMRGSSADRKTAIAEAAYQCALTIERSNPHQSESSPAGA